MIDSVVLTQYQRVKDRQTDRQGDGRAELMYQYRALHSCATLTRDKMYAKHQTRSTSFFAQRVTGVHYWKPKFPRSTF